MSRLFAPCTHYRRLSWWQRLTLIALRPEHGCPGCYWNYHEWPCPRMVRRIRRALEEEGG